MRLYRLFFSALALIAVQTAKGEAKPDQMSITFEIAQVNRRQYDVKTFQSGEAFFQNRTYQFIRTPKQFEGFQFISSWGGNEDHGVIIPDADGTVYVLGPKGGLAGWEAEDNAELTYMANALTYASVYRKKVTAGQRLEIRSEKGNFIGISPLAAKINLKVLPAGKEARLRGIMIDGVEVENFMPEEERRTHYLPYTYNGVPKIEATGFTKGITYSITQQATNIHGNDRERSVLITSFSPDSSVVRKYSVQYVVVPRMDIFVCIGQSNMAGYSPIDIEKGDLEPVKNAFLLNGKGVFEALKNPLNRYSNVRGNIYGQQGLTYAFAKTLSTVWDRPIGFVVNAKGGSSINSWTKGASDQFYGKTFARIEEAKKWGDVKAVLWHQGERDRMEYTVYPEKLRQLVTDLRKDLGNESLLFIAGQIGEWMPGAKPFNDMIATISSFIPNTAYVRTNKLTNADNAHFDRESALLLGERYAAEVLRYFSK